MAPARAPRTSTVLTAACSHSPHPQRTLPLPHPLSARRRATQVVSVKGSSGWAFEMALKTSGEAALFDKYSVAEYVQVGGLWLGAPGAERAVCRRLSRAGRRLAVRAPEQFSAPGLHGTSARAPNALQICAEGGPRVPRSCFATPQDNWFVLAAILKDE